VCGGLLELERNGNGGVVTCELIFLEGDESTTASTEKMIHCFGP
jgi:hypothetical protein